MPTESGGNLRRRPIGSPTDNRVSKAGPLTRLSLVTTSLAQLLFPPQIRRWLIAGICLRLLLIPTTTWPDTVWFMTWSKRMLSSPEALLSGSFYTSPFYLVSYLFIKPLSFLYPPSSYSMPAPDVLDRVSIMTGAFYPHIPTPTFSLIFKTPYLFADLAVALTIYYTLHLWTQDSLRAKQGALLWFMNPLTITASAIMGQNDAVVTGLLLVSFYLLLKGKYFSMSMSSTLALLYKNYIALAVLFLVGAALRSIMARPAKEQKARDISFLLLGTALPLLALYPTLRYFGAKFLIRVTAPTLGGFNVWGVLNFLPAASGIMSWANANFQELETTLAALGTAIALAIAVRAVLRPGEELSRNILHGLVAILTVTYLFAPLTNPHNLVPLIGAAAIVVAVDRRWALPYVILSISTTLYIFAITGPLVLLLPIMGKISSLDAGRLLEATLSYLGQGGIVTQFLHRDFMTICAVAGFGALVVLFMNSLRLLRSDHSLGAEWERSN